MLKIIHHDEDDFLFNAKKTDKKTRNKAGFFALLKLTLQQIHSDGQIDLSLQI